MHSDRFLCYLKKEKLVKKATCYHSLSFVVTRCHSLSLVAIRCHSLSLGVPLVVPLVLIRWHSLSLVVPLVATCHSLWLDVSLACLFIKVLRCLLLNGVKSLQIIYFSQHSYCLMNFLEKFLFLKQVFHLQKPRTKYLLSSSHVS